MYYQAASGVIEEFGLGHMLDSTILIKESNAPHTHSQSLTPVGPEPEKKTQHDKEDVERP